MIYVDTILMSGLSIRQMGWPDAYETSGAKLVIVALRADDGNIRFWHAKKASSVVY